jgi:hypothetical protein
MNVLPCLFFIGSTIALLPSWAFASVTWRCRHGRWIWLLLGSTRVLPTAL